LDPDRFLRPYITAGVLAELFGPEAAAVKARFLEATGAGGYRLKPQFETQRGVEAYFTGRQPSPQNEALKRGLFDLISNVILLEARDESAGCHFRFGIETTPSFRDLDEQTRTRLWELYIDYFYHRQEEGWRKEGLEKLALLKRATNMLVCGEDLGMVPACVPDVMRQLGVLSLEVQRMPKRLGLEFSRPSEAPYLSVVTPSTHDMSTLRGWWREHRNMTQRFFNTELGQPGPAPDQCEPWISHAILTQHLASPALWSVFQLQDLLGLDAAFRRQTSEGERINVPANPENHWSYRMPLTLEDLLAAAPFNAALKADIQRHGR
jgi:4-alpha-glucanotransferase